MTQPTHHLRWVERSDGNSMQRVLQQWWEAEGWEHPDTVAVGGLWQDVPLVMETDHPPIEWEKK